MRDASSLRQPSGACPRVTERSARAASPRHPRSTATGKKSGARSTSRNGAKHQGNSTKVRTTEGKCSPVSPPVRKHCENSSCGLITATTHDDLIAISRSLFGGDLENLTRSPEFQTPTSESAVGRDGIPRIRSSFDVGTADNQPDRDLKSLSMGCTVPAGGNILSVLESWVSASLRSWVELLHYGSFLPYAWSLQSRANEKARCVPILLNVCVMDSPGPLRLVVDKNVTVQETIDFALRRYTCQRRQPAISEPSQCFDLFCRDLDCEALDGDSRVGDRWSRDFHLYRKQDVDLIFAKTSVVQSPRKPTTAAVIKSSLCDKVAKLQSWTSKLISRFADNITVLAKRLNAF